MARFAVISIAIVLSPLFTVPVYGADDDVAVSVTDDREYIRPGGAVVYRIVINDTSDTAKTITPVFTLSDHANLSSDNGGIVAGQTVTWPATVLERGKETVFTVIANVSSGISEGTVLRARVEVLGQEAEDRTVISSTPITSNHFILSITDAKVTVSPGQHVRYTATIKNVSNVSRSTPVTMILPAQYDIGARSPVGSFLQGTTVEWQPTVLTPGEEKTFAVEARLGARVPEYLLLTAQLLAGGSNAVDTTSVQTAMSSRSASSSSVSSRSRAVIGQTPRASPSILLSQTAESNEVLAGGRIGYTIFVQNVLLSVLRDATVTVQYNPRELTPINAQNAINGQGILTWNIPNLQPGATWTMSYEMVADTSLPAGSSVQTVATVSGPETDMAVLTERVSIAQSDVVVDLPQTGADFNLLALAFIAAASLGSAVCQQRTIRLSVF